MLKVALGNFSGYSPEKVAHPNNFKDHSLSIRVLQTTPTPENEAALLIKYLNMQEYIQIRPR